MNHDNSNLPIFLHSWFRSGSTYLWTKFRSIENLTSYYEPLHEQISTLDHESAAANPDHVFINHLRHPAQEKNYFYEYKDLINQNRLNFDRSISYDRYVLNPNDQDEKLKVYISELIYSSRALFKRPVLCFCRSQMRAAWFSANFEALHIAHIRNPVDQWNSFNISGYFIDKIFRTAHGIECVQPGLFNGIPKFQKYLNQKKNTRPSMVSTYSQIPVTFDEVFLIFLLIWILSSLYAIRNTHYLIDIDTLSQKNSVKNDTSSYFFDLGIKINFDDCKIETSDITMINKFEIQKALKVVIKHCANEHFIKLFEEGLRQIPETKFISSSSYDFLNLYHN